MEVGASVGAGVGSGVAVGSGELAAVDAAVLAGLSPVPPQAARVEINTKQSKNAVILFIHNIPFILVHPITQPNFTLYIPQKYLKFSPGS